MEKKKVDLLGKNFQSLSAEVLNWFYRTLSMIYMIFLTHHVSCHIINF